MREAEDERRVRKGVFFLSLQHQRRPVDLFPSLDSIREIERERQRERKRERATTERAGQGDIERERESCGRGTVGTERERQADRGRERTLSHRCSPSPHLRR